MTLTDDSSLRLRWAVGFGMGIFRGLEDMSKKRCDDKASANDSGPRIVDASNVGLTMGVGHQLIFTSTRRYSLTSCAPVLRDKARIVRLQ